MDLKEALKTAARPGYGQSPVFLVAVPYFADIAAHSISLPDILTTTTKHLAVDDNPSLPLANISAVYKYI